MKKIALSLICLSVLALPVLAMAADPVLGDRPGEVSDFNSLIKTILDFAWVVFVVLAIIMFIVAGILFLTAQGDPTKVATARNAFLWGVVGIVVGIIAFSIVQIVGTAVG